MVNCDSNNMLNNVCIKMLEFIQSFTNWTLFPFSPQNSLDGWENWDSSWGCPLSHRAELGHLSLSLGLLTLSVQGSLHHSSLLVSPSSKLCRLRTCKY